MFNYDAESNALAILRSMFRETVPAWEHYKNEELFDWERRMSDAKKVLPPHPNIVAMYSVFADKVPFLPGSIKMYPDALPSRLNPEGSGRNMSLFLVMKRFYNFYLFIIIFFFIFIVYKIEKKNELKFNTKFFFFFNRYDLTLRQYMTDHELNVRESILLFAQLLEAIVHMNSHKIAHR